MDILKKLPGPLLVFLGAVFLSFGGLIVKSFEGANLWQILFWRQLFFVFIISIYLTMNYKKDVFNKIYLSGFPGLIGGIILGIGFSSYVFAMYNTTVANTNFIIQTQTIFLAIFGYFFLKEKISIITLISIILAISGLLLMLGNSLSGGKMLGNIIAFIMPITFASLILIVRKYPHLDMVPLQLVAGIVALLIGFFVSNKILISTYDIFLAFLSGTFQLGLGFIFITIGARKTLSAMVGIIMLTEAILGPFWAWLFVNEDSSFYTIIGGSIIIFAVFLQFVSSIKKETKYNAN